MICTELEASKKWCPLTVDRHADKITCLGPSCMLWVWVTEDGDDARKGRCGLQVFGGWADPR